MRLMRQILRIIVLVAIFFLTFGCTEGKRSPLEPKEPKRMCVVDLVLVDSSAPYWLPMSDVYASTSLDTGAYYLGQPYWLRRLPDEHRASFMVEEGQNFYLSARHYYGYTIAPYGDGGAKLIMASDWNVLNPIDTANGVRVSAKTRFYSGFWRTSEFDALGRPIWKEHNNEHIWRIREVTNGLSNVNTFSRQRAAYFLESTYEVKTFQCVKEGTTRLSSRNGVVFQRIDFTEPTGVLSTAEKIPGVIIKTRFYGTP